MIIILDDKKNQVAASEDGRFNPPITLDIGDYTIHEGDKWWGLTVEAKIQIISVY